MKPLAKSAGAMVLLCLALTAPRAQQRSLTTAEIAKLAIPATVTILTLDSRGDTTGLGSGFLVSPDGTIVTNWHVVAGADSAVVVLATGERYSRVIGLAGDQDADVAVVKIPGASLPHLRTQDVLPQVGDRLVAIGSPLGLAQTVSEGIVSGRRTIDGREMVQMSVPISPGSSGGPVLNAEGEVVAISTAYLASGQALNFAVPVRYANSLLRGHPQGRSLLELFPESPRHPERAETPRPGESPYDLAPPRASHPRLSLAGSYGGVLTGAQSGAYCASATSGHYVPVAHLRSVIGDSGWGTMTFTEVESGERKGGGMRTVTTPTGQANLLSDQQPNGGGGYQTDSGMVFISSMPRAADGCAAQVRLILWQVESLPSDPTGRYRAYTRGEWILKADTTKLDLVGEAQVVVLADSIYLSFQFAGRTGLAHGFAASLRGKISPNGDFLVESHREHTGVYVSLKGSLREGKITASVVGVFGLLSTDLSYQGFFGAIRK